MKQLWTKLSLRIDALSLRERAVVFAASAATIIFVVYSMMLAPLLNRQKVLLGTIGQQQNQVSAIDAAITEQLRAYALDPDGPNRVRLQAIEQELAQISGELRSVQKGLVAPEKMIPLLEQLLRGNDRLRLMSLRNLPVSGFDQATIQAASEKAAMPSLTKSDEIVGAVHSAAPAKPVPDVPIAQAPELLYRHGVQIVLQGSYLDMIDYMSKLEALPTQLFWGKARLETGDYPNATLTLTLYTLSLDEKWMTL